jgi:hypothetical protein
MYDAWSTKRQLCSDTVSPLNVLVPDLYQAEIARVTAEKQLPGLFVSPCW